VIDRANVIFVLTIINVFGSREDESFISELTFHVIIQMQATDKQLVACFFVADKG
jgi:hypothetical protein